MIERPRHSSGGEHPLGLQKKALDQPQDQGGNGTVLSTQEQREAGAEASQWEPSVLVSRRLSLTVSSGALLRCYLFART